jgi:hypothetical protein
MNAMRASYGLNEEEQEMITVVREFAEQHNSLGMCWSRWPKSIFWLCPFHQPMVGLEQVTCWW